MNESDRSRAEGHATARARRVATGILSGVLIASPMAASAQNDSELRAYAVEIILFRPSQQADLDERQWREAAQAAADATATTDEELVLDPDGSVTPEVDAAGASAPELEPFADGFGYLSEEGLPPVYRYEPPLPERFAALAPETRELSTLFDRLNRSSAYEPLLHERWMQLTYPRDVANPRPITVQREDLAIDGTVKLAVERRLHLELDLTLSQPGGVDYQLQQARVMTSGELHYVDHPAFGAVCRITPVELPDGYPDGMLEDLLQDARLYGADPDERLQSLPWPPPAPPATESMPDEMPEPAPDDDPSAPNDQTTTG
ncbi:MAG: CsiV family protein [Pseudomonadota bacterium]